jgi:serine/threonine-protein phosphatase 2B catalytic subunit
VSVGADEKSKPDWKLLKDFLLKEGPMRKDQVSKLLRDGIALMGKLSEAFIFTGSRINFKCLCALGKESNLVRIGEPIVIVGDLHG